MSKIKFVRYSGIVIFLAALLLFLPQDLKEKYIVNNGQKIEAEILEMPTCCSCKNIYAKFKYNDFIFHEKVWRSFCLDYKVGDSVGFFHHEKYPEIFVFQSFEKSYLTMEMISTFALMLFGIFCFFYSFKKGIKT